MAIPTFVGESGRFGGVGNQTPSWPAGHQADDIGILWIETANQAVPATPDGWNVVPDSPQGEGTGGDAAATRLTLFWRRATSGTESSPSTGDSGDHQICGMAAFRGCITTGDPYDVTAGDTAAVATDAVSVPGDTTTVADCLITAWVAHSTDIGSSVQVGSWANADLANVTERFDWSGANAGGGGVSMATGEKATAGAFGATTATLVTASLQGRIMVALKPPAAGGAAAPDTWHYRMTAQGAHFG